MNDHFEKITLNAAGATSLSESEIIQSLWSGYGKIVRCALEGSDLQSVIVKHVHWPTREHHPRGWNTGRSHERKVRSYQVETEWYRNLASRCDDACRIPKCYALETHGDEVFMVLEDLDAAGFPGRRGSVNNSELRACLSWLAHFHAQFMHEPPEGLWETGTYWHLETRPDELAELDDGPLKQSADAIDRKLNASPYQTLVHGDAKLANFCFSETSNSVAAVDFQYVGGGCGMKDVAYFISSCLCENECEAREQELLDYYFGALCSALSERKSDVNPDEVEADWRALYAVAWTDFFRFLQGWSPGHWKIHRYSERLTREVLEQL